MSEKYQQQYFQSYFQNQTNQRVSFEFTSLPQFNIGEVQNKSSFNEIHTN